MLHPGRFPRLCLLGAVSALVAASLAACSCGQRAEPPHQSLHAASERLAPLKTCSWTLAQPYWADLQVEDVSWKKRRRLPFGQVEQRYEELVQALMQAASKEEGSVLQYDTGAYTFMAKDYPLNLAALEKIIRRYDVPLGEPPRG